MLFNALSLMALSATMTSAFTLPPDAQNGVYRVYKAANGADVFELIAPADAAPPSEPNFSFAPGARALRALTTRSLIACGCGVGMDHGDTDKANSNLQSQVKNGRSVPSHGALLAKSGSTAAFFCNYDGSDTTARKDEAVGGASAITGACGLYIAGTIRLDGHPHLDFGYMDVNRGDFCGHAEDSSLRHC
jgi:hypothetical protein